MAVYGVPAGHQVANFSGLGGAYFVRFSPGGKRLAVGSKPDGTFYVWDTLPVE
jgi:WD40 repeat protein